MIKDKYGNEVSMYNMSRAYGQFRDLYFNYLDHKDIKGKEEIKSRIEYIKKHGVKQRTEIETLCWVIGEDIVGNKKED